MRPTTYCALDLEFNQPSKRVIQIGLCMGTWGSGEPNYERAVWYVDPGEPIAEFITKLTGITDEDIRTKAKPLEQIASEVLKFLDRPRFVNPVVWGEGDARALRALFESTGVAQPHFGHRSIDVKTIFVFLNAAESGPTRGSLGSALKLYKLGFEGDSHRADVDALNTLRLFFHLLDKQHHLVSNAKAA